MPFHIWIYPKLWPVGTARFPKFSSSFHISRLEFLNICMVDIWVQIILSFGGQEWVGTVLCIAGFLVTSLAPSHQVPGARSTSPELCLPGKMWWEQLSPHNIFHRITFKLTWTLYIFTVRNRKVCSEITRVAKEWWPLMKSYYVWIILPITRVSTSLDFFISYQSKEHPTLGRFCSPIPSSHAKTNSLALGSHSTDYHNCLFNVGFSSRLYNPWGHRPTCHCHSCIPNF